MTRKERVYSIAHAIIRINAGMLTEEGLAAEVAARPQVTGTVTPEEAAALVERKAWTEAFVEKISGYGLIQDKPQKGARVGGHFGVGSVQKRFSEVYKELYFGREQMSDEGRGDIIASTKRFGVKAVDVVLSSVVAETPYRRRVYFALPGENGKEKEPVDSEAKTA